MRARRWAAYLILLGLGLPPPPALQLTHYKLMFRYGIFASKLIPVLLQPVGVRVMPRDPRRAVQSCGRPQHVNICAMLWFTSDIVDPQLSNVVQSV
jgi:hypothetical protein